ncbi:MAG: hypothetical protein J6F31_03195 [Oscillospiraceae bacterium]|nr:hypothetical protein [Oscillospiraceae bacterium]
MAKYEVEKKYMIIYLCMVAVSAFCMISRWINIVNPDVKLLPDLLLTHITNFALCMMALLIFGFVVLCFGGRLEIITLATILIAALGVVYECFLPFLNTPDIGDAVFGVAGTVVAYIYLVMLKKNGLIARETNSDLTEQEKIRCPEEL